MTTAPHEKDAEMNQPVEALDLIWGARDITKYLNMRSTKQVFRLLESGQLPARKVGRAWVASRAALREHFAKVVAPK